MLFKKWKLVTGCEANICTFGEINEKGIPVGAGGFATPQVSPFRETADTFRNILIFYKRASTKNTSISTR